MIPDPLTAWVIGAIACIAEALGFVELACVIVLEWWEECARMTNDETIKAARADLDEVYNHSTSETVQDAMVSWIALAVGATTHGAVDRRAWLDAFDDDYERGGAKLVDLLLKVWLA